MSATDQHTGPSQPAPAVGRPRIITLVALLVPVLLALAGCTPGASATGWPQIPVPKPAPATPAVPGSTLALLESIPVKGKAPKTGYARTQFGQAWRDTERNGCDQRNDRLRAQLSEVVIKPGTRGCVVLSGVLEHDPYTGATIHFERGGASELDVDHLVALKDAWVKGAQNWDPSMRERLATDPSNLLVVASGPNRAKGSADLATWLPPNKSFRCTYAARIVAVKAEYGLWMTRAEHDTARRILSACPAGKR
jgi:Protein of unknown function (DUF1524)